MYEAFYGFKEKPFSMLPDPDFLYLSKKHQAALTLLEYGLLNHVGFCVVSGEAGAGKTTILRALLERVEDNITIGLITNTHQSFGGLLDWVLSAFDLHKPNLTHVEMHQVFMEYLIEEYAKGNTVLLIVDEAQNMNPDALEELRMLSNVNSEKDQLMQVVLAGQPALKDTLRLPELMQFAQRVAVDYHLDPLNLEETCGYIQHRLIIAGAQKDVFTPAACQRIHNYSGGTPRLINLLCETVLVYGFADQQEVIDIDLVDEMVLERMKDSVVPIVNRDIAKQGNKNIDEILVKNFPSINPAEKGVVRERLAKEKSVKEEVKIATTNKVEPEKIAKKIVVENKKKEEIKDKKKESQEKGALEKGALEKRGLEKRGQGKEAQKKAPSEKIEQPSSQSSTSAASEKNTGAMIDSVLFSAESGDSAGISEDSRGAKKQIIKYGAFAVVAAAVFIVIALMFGGEKAIFVVIPDVVENASKNMVKNSSKEAMLQKEHEQAELEKKRALEEKQLRQAQMEAETLKKESEEAIAKAEKEKLAAEKAARAEKAAAKKRRLAEEKRADTAKRSARKAKQEAAKAKEETAQLKREAEKLEEQRRVMKARLDEEWRLKRQLERERAIELDKLEIQRLELEENASQAAATAAEVSAAEKAAEQSKSADCSGPTARFKSGCR